MVDNDRTVSVAEAAAALGVSTDAIRKRLLRGTIEGHKVAGQWRVTLPDTGTPATDTRPETVTPAQIEDLRDTIEDLRRRLDIATDKHAADDARVDSLIADLRDARQRADTLQAMNLQLLALQPGDPPENEAVESPVSPGNDATGISTHVETEHATPSRWARFLALFKPD